MIDLDKNTFEVYEGFNNNPITYNERFYYLQDEGYRASSGDIYYPVRFVISFDLDNLPSEEEFLSNFNEE